MRDVVIFSDSDLIRLALKTIIEPVITYQSDSISTVIKVCASLLEFELEILTAIKPVAIFDIDNVSILNQFYILKVIKGKTREINFIIFSKENKLPGSYSHLKNVNLTHLSKAATVMEIESMIYQCFYRLVTSFNKIPNISSLRKNKNLELTKRESQILPLLMFGMTNKNIADLLNVSAKTINCHKISILKKYKKTNMIELYNKWK
ncbi:helix-turn-helix domain-containing protein [Yersinia intermedia]|uniref:helix-turn-helix domain-containing protein n=1 Tax=Yersinia intermedia TaxID=631 RepID=UPI000B6B6798|nr:LuxR C-terminal-related transcriptional regulator [Yersinia intermedia]MCW8114268.1 LuxR C-terminal-related transcriptional regulator [Yersinia intermedia]MDA5519043.1 LuxR C-terminal-related transcriptional regulator [Yersinia intermedia]OWF92172.1 hypothetical protein B4916_05865 [Yersinia intermedia]